MNLIEHTLLTLDFWQDNVTYEGKSMPTGTLACTALNLSDEVIAKLSQLCIPLNLYMGGAPARIGKYGADGSDGGERLSDRGAFTDVPPFSFLEYEIVRSYVDAVFTEDYLQNTIGLCEV